jgi:hypothetical protein
MVKCFSGTPDSVKFTFLIRLTIFVFKVAWSPTVPFNKHFPESEYGSESWNDKKNGLRRVKLVIF